LFGFCLAGQFALYEIPCTGICGTVFGIPDWWVQFFFDILLSPLSPTVICFTEVARRGTRMTDLQKQAHQPADCKMDVDVSKDCQAQYRIGVTL
jgi:hypothetical protein